MSLYSGTSQLLRSAYHVSCCCMIYYKYQWHATFMLWITKKRRLCGQSWPPVCLNWSNSKTIAGNQAQRNLFSTPLSWSCWQDGVSTSSSTLQHPLLSPLAWQVGWEGSLATLVPDIPHPPQVLMGENHWWIRSDPRSNNPHTYTPEQVCQLLMSNRNYPFKAFLKTWSSHLAYQCLLR